MKRWTANVVTLSRLALLVPWIRLMRAGSAWALPVIAAIVASDLLDGPIARRLATASGRGALMDATCDALVVAAATVTLGLGDARYLGLAGLVTAAFASWGAYSLVIGRFAYTRLGRYNGAFGYLLVFVASARPWLTALGSRVPVVGEWAVIGLVAISLGISTAENIAGALRTDIGPPAVTRLES